MTPEQRDRLTVEAVHRHVRREIFTFVALIVGIVACIVAMVLL